LGYKIYKNKNNQNVKAVIVKDNVKIITRETDQAEQPIQISDDGLVFKEKPEFKVGDVIVSGITPIAKNGFIRRVVRIEMSNDACLVQTESALLTDVFEKLHIVKQIELTEHGVEEVGSDTNYDGNDTTYYAFRIPFEEKDQLISISGEVGYNILVELQIDINHGDITYGIVTKNKSEGNIALRCNDSTNENIQKKVYSNEFSKYEFVVEGVPIVLTNDMAVFIEAAVKSDGDIGISYDVTSENTLGFQYNGHDGIIEEIKTSDSNSEGLKWNTAEFEGDASTNMNLHLITKLYGCTGSDIYSGISGNVIGEAKLTTNEKLNGYAGSLDLEIRPQIKGNIIAGNPITDGELVEQPLFEESINPIWTDHWESSSDWKADLKWTETGDKGNTYITRYGEENKVTCPTFQFDYPKRWHVQSEEINSDATDIIAEKVVISNDRGVTVTYWDCQRPLGGYSRVMLKSDISKVDNCDFVPNIPSGTDSDYSGLGEFIVARIHIIGEMFIGIDADYVPVDRTFFAVVPSSYVGEKEFIGQAGNVDEFSFEYPTPHAFIAEAPDDMFTAKEEKDIISIMKSFKAVE
ncbi:MAG: hypothetical protein ACI4E3_07380, partial [Candidatus Fimousia sp.]